METEIQLAAARGIKRARETWAAPIGQMVARAILADLEGRKGWSDQIAKTDPEVVESEILETWAEIVRQLLEERDHRRHVHEEASR